MKRLSILILLVISAVCLLVSCATSADGALIGEGIVKSQLRDGDYSSAVKTVETYKDKYEDPIIYHLDAGLTDFYAGNYKEAAENLAEAERVIEENKTKSISQGVASYIVNDNVRDYPGELYEDVATNIISSLSYLNMGNLEDAMVEVRRANIKLVDYEINVKEQESGLVNLVYAFTKNPWNYLPVLDNVQSYNYSPLATYVSMLLYNMDGDYDNANVDYKKIVAKGQGAGAVSEEDVFIPSGKGRLNVISFEGLIGQKYERSTMGSSLLGSRTVSHKIAWPWISLDSETTVSRVTVNVGGKSFQLSMVEDFTQDALETLHMDIKSTYLRSFYRGLVKMKAAIAAAEQANSAAKGATSSSSNPLLKLAADKAIDTAIKKGLEEVNNSEKADTRMGNYLPDQASAGGITLDPGTYEVQVIYEFKNSSKKDIRTFTVDIVAGKNTLITSSCAK